MKKVVVVYDTRFGNTEKVAKALAGGMKGKTIKVDLVKADEADTAKLADYDLLAFGAPTHAFGISQPMKQLMGKLSGDRLKGKKAIAFDTRIVKWWTGSAAKKMEDKLRNLGLIMVKPHQSAGVKGREGPLVDGAEVAFEKIGHEIAELLK